MTEEQLIHSCLQQDRKAQKALYERHAGTMYAIAVRYTKNVEEARDVLQEGFIKAFTHLSRYRKEGSFEGWLKRIFIHTAITHYHKLKARQNHVPEEPAHHESEEEAVSAIDRISEKELLHLISSLPEGYRVVFNLSVIEGYSHDEISQLLGITASTSRSQLLKARRMLQARIIEMNSIAI